MHTSYTPPPVRVLLRENLAEIDNIYRIIILLHTFRYVLLKFQT